MQIGVIGEIFQLVLLVIGIDGNEYGSYFGRGEKEREPIGNVGCPNTDV